MTQDGKKRIIVFGGSFDPPHDGHEGLARYVIEHGIADEVWFTPCGQHAFDKRMSPKEHRVAMTKLAVEGLNRETKTDKFKLCTVEANKVGTSFTYETLNQIAKDHPEAEIGFLMGEDQLEKFEKWGNWRELLARYKIYVYPRGENMRDLLKEGMIYLEGAPRIERESAGIRKEVMAGEGELLGLRAAVREYTLANHLYE